MPTDTDVLSRRHSTRSTAISETQPADREIELSSRFKLPERLLLAHSRGEVLFITGTGISRSAGLPDFRGLVLEVYKRVDHATHEVLNTILQETCTGPGALPNSNTMASPLSPEQQAEVARFQVGDYDLVLGMIERRIDSSPLATSKVRKAVADTLRSGEPKATQIHRSLIRLADRGASTVIVTTNFDLLLEDAARRRRLSIPSLALGAISRPSLRVDFSGILHIHGALTRDPRLPSDLIVTDQDFGEFYLRRRIVPDFIYDAARLYHLVLVGYSANDAPMRYLLNAVAADSLRFSDLKERFVLVGTNWPPDDKVASDWKGRGITPIFYPDDKGHEALGCGLAKWASLSAFNSDPRFVNREHRRLTRRPRGRSSDADRDLFDHFIRRGSAVEATRVAHLISQRKADISWLDSLLAILREPGRGAEPMIKRLSDPSFDQGLYSATRSFISTRFQERSTVEWALDLRPDRRAERLVIENAFDYTSDGPLSEPWRTTWSWILEKWRTQVRLDLSEETYTIQRLIKRGERTGNLIERIVDLVRPIVKVEPPFIWRAVSGQSRACPRALHDLISVRLTSGRLVFPEHIALGEIDEPWFLKELGHAVEAAVIKGIDIGRRIGWDEEEDGGFWRLGGLSRVYLVRPSGLGDDRGDPDGHSNGIAPSVKILHAMVTHLVEHDEKEARNFVDRWRAMRFSPVHTRLWAAVAVDRRLATAGEVGEFLRSCNDREFWAIHSYPEVAEVRARRFSELSDSDQATVLRRLKKRPPRRFFPELREMSRLDEGFPEGIHFESVSRTPDSDSGFDFLKGEMRLKALEAALRSREAGLADPSSGAHYWLRLPGSAAAIVTDLESLPEAGGGYTSVWAAFANAHMPPTGTLDNSVVGSGSVRNLAERVLGLLIRLPEDAARSALGGITYWMSRWQMVIRDSKSLSEVWAKLWPLAVDAANEQQEDDRAESSNAVSKDERNVELTDSRHLTTPVGQLVGVFVAKSLALKPADRPFDQDRELRRMRDLIAAASGRPWLIALPRMLWIFDWFLRADRDWTRDHLITPLLSDDPEILPLWQAVAHRTLFTAELQEIGAGVLRRVTDSRLRRDTRESLAWSLVMEALHALREEREPAVSYPNVQQMLRSVDDEVRAYAASGVQRFVSELSDEKSDAYLSSPEELFWRAAKPFIETVWPQEHSLSTQGVSQSFVRLPAACGEEFGRAVATIGRFIVPFPCWWLGDYGLDSAGEDSPGFTQIDNREKAEALLLLLDGTIGSTQDAVVPLNLDQALDHVRKLAPRVKTDPRYRRLAALARRNG